MPRTAEIARQTKEMVLATGLNVDGANYALCSEHIGSFLYEAGILDRCGVKGYLVRACIKKGPDIFDGPDAASDGKRNKYFIGNSSGHLDRGAS